MVFQDEDGRASEPFQSSRQTNFAICELSRASSVLEVEVGSLSLLFLSVSRLKEVVKGLTGPIQGPLGRSQVIATRRWKVPRAANNAVVHFVARLLDSSQGNDRDSEGALE